MRILIGPLLAADPRVREFPTLGVTIIVAAFCAPAANAQSSPSESALKASLSREESKEGYLRSEAFASNRSSKGSRGHELCGVSFHKKRFVTLSVAAYAASLADMHETIRVRNESWWYERDPLARPIVRLPMPAYYASGLALATAVNWLSWKMGHSRKWRRIAPLPQLFSIAGNTYGFKSNYNRH